MQLGLTVEEICKIIDGTPKGMPSFLVSGLNRLDNASEGELSFALDSKRLLDLDDTFSGSVLLLKYDDFADELFEKYASLKSVILIEDPYSSIVKLLRYLRDNDETYIGNLVGGSDSAKLSDGAEIGKGFYIGSYSSVEDGCTIGNNVKIGSNVSIGKGCTIGDGTIIKDGSRICEGSVVGRECIIHENAVIGSEGFGFTYGNGGYERIPQLGNVIIGDRCDIGACTTIDRAMVGSTIIGDGVIIDNLVQIAHNVEIGDGSAFAAQAGVAGSTKLGKGVRMGGQSGTAGHIRIADGVTVLARGGVAQSIEKAGEYFGGPARPKREAFRIEAVVPQLPEMYKEINRLRDVIEKLKMGNSKKED
ncbi:MAG: UDP-3-O-(3-hydroxymyristoyl)glucosamine N-acyltransferase [Candidatus Kapaibacteriales bacterium]